MYGVRNLNCIWESNRFWSAYSTWKNMWKPCFKPCYVFVWGCQSGMSCLIRSELELILLIYPCMHACMHALIKNIYIYIYMLNLVQGCQTCWDLSHMANMKPVFWDFLCWRNSIQLDFDSNGHTCALIGWSHTWVSVFGYVKNTMHHHRCNNSKNQT